MSQSARHEHRFPCAGVSSPVGDGVDDGLTETVSEVVVQPLARLTSHDLADLAATVADRGLVEHAVGVLMLVYDLDADNAVEVLKWGSKARGVTVRLLARQLTDDVVGPADVEGLLRCERVDLRSACDDVLFRQQRASPVSRRGHEPGSTITEATASVHLHHP